MVRMWLGLRQAWYMGFDPLRYPMNGRASSEGTFEVVELSVGSLSSALNPHP